MSRELWELNFPGSRPTSNALLPRTIFKKIGVGNKNKVPMGLRVWNVGQVLERESRPMVFSICVSHG